MFRDPHLTWAERLDELLELERTPPVSEEIDRLVKQLAGAVPFTAEGCRAQFQAGAMFLGLDRHEPDDYGALLMQAVGRTIDSRCAKPYEPAVSISQTIAANMTAIGARFAPTAALMVLAGCAAAGL